MTPDVQQVLPRYSQRLASVRMTMAELALDALLVTHPPNLRYLVGFDGSMGALLLSRTRALLILDGRYLTAARQHVTDTAELQGVEVELATRAHEDVVAAVATADDGLARIGVEAAVMTLSRFERLMTALRTSAEANPTPTLVPVERTVERARLIKDESEVAALREAAARLSRVARRVPSFAQPGRREREVAADIDAALRQGGFERPAFETIVASGPNSALPHARPTERVLEPGDPVVLDFGGVYDGYCVDLTRTIQIVRESDAFGQLFEAVRSAHAAAIAAVKPGIKASAVDAAARTALARCGLADAFVHGTGHGLGLEVHEEPRISKPGTASPDETLQPGMVFTIEPGVYVPGVGGVRIEDDVLVVDRGCDILTDVPIDRSGRGTP